MIPVMKAGNEEMPEQRGNSTMVGNTGNGFAKISLLKTDSAEITPGMVFAFTSRDSEETFEVPKTGNYKLEVWGAQGGGSLINGSFSENTSYGAYSVGYVNLNAGDILYVNVGGAGSNPSVGKDSPGGYNGGGSGTWDHGDNETAGGGGGATHIAYRSGELWALSGNIDQVLIVAGGSGGKGWDTSNGSGGGYIAGPSGDGRKANQTSGYQFGKGQNATGVGDGDGHGGGGGGFYGGYESSSSSGSTEYGGGGSGYIGNIKLTDKAMYCYNCDESTEVSTKTVSTTCFNEKATENCAKSGNGYAKITFIN
jgi:hypothetical protein